MSLVIFVRVHNIDITTLEVKLSNKDVDERTLTFTVQWCIPKNNTFVRSGLIATKDSTLIYKDKEGNEKTIYTNVVEGDLS